MALSQRWMSHIVGLSKNAGTELSRQKFFLMNKSLVGGQVLSTWPCFERMLSEWLAPGMVIVGRSIATSVAKVLSHLRY